jgi:rhodanese-related sulfurtransferase
MIKNVTSRYLLAWLLALLTGFAQAADQYLVEASPETVDGSTLVNNSEAKALFDKGVVFIDVRTKKGFDSGRIPDAELLDLKEGFNKEALEALVKPDQEVVIYCQGVKCKRAAEAINQALSWGYTKVYYYREGFPGWKQAGYPVE